MIDTSRPDARGHALAIAREIGAAIGCLTVLRRPAAGVSPQALAGGLAWYPLVGLVNGAVAAGGAALVGRHAPALAGAAGVLVLGLLDGARPLRALAAVAGALPRRAARGAPGPRALAAAAAVVGAKVWAAGSLPAPALAMALALASMLGAWAITVQCYGGAPAGVPGTGAALVGRARFREFGWASLGALGVALAAGDAAGLVVVLVAAAVTVGVRVWAYRRLGGLTGHLLMATRELVETAVLVTLGLLAT